MQLVYMFNIISHSSMEIFRKRPRLPDGLHHSVSKALVVRQWACTKPTREISPMSKARCPSVHQLKLGERSCSVCKR